MGAHSCGVPLFLLTTIQLKLLSFILLRHASNATNTMEKMILFESPMMKSFFLKKFVVTISKTKQKVVIFRGNL